MSDLSLMSSVYHKPREEFITRISQSVQPENDVVGQDDEEIDEEERAATRRQVEEEMKGNTNGDRSRRPESSPTSGGDGLDLLDLDGGLGDASPTAAAPTMRTPLKPT